MKIKFLSSLMVLCSIQLFSQGIQTQTRNDAGASGTGVLSGFYQTSTPVNFPNNTQNVWWHLLDVRLTNFNNNYAMQFSGSFSDQHLYFRKTNNVASQPWSKVVLENPQGNVGIGTNVPLAKLHVKGHVRFNNESNHTYVSLGKDLNDAIIVDNTPEKHYGGGYFFRVDSKDEPIKYIDALLIKDDGLVSIPKILEVSGTSSFKSNMKVNAKIEAKEVKVTTTPTADFVFEEDYDLPKLEDVEKHIKEKKHLPEIASAKEMEANGVNIGEFQIKLLQKIEELTLYSIEQNKEQKLQAEKIQQLESIIKEMNTSKNK